MSAEDAQLEGAAREPLAGSIEVLHRRLEAISLFGQGMQLTWVISFTRVSSVLGIVYVQKNIYNKENKTDDGNSSHPKARGIPCPFFFDPRCPWQCIVVWHFPNLNAHTERVFGCKIGKADFSPFSFHGWFDAPSAKGAERLIELCNRSMERSKRVRDLQPLMKSARASL